MIRIGVIGYGYWGPNLVRNFAESPHSNVVRICDRDEARRQRAQARYPAAAVAADPSEMIACADIDAVVIATPVSTHFSLAMEALDAGKHVLVEKPLAETPEQCRKLIDEAESRGTCLMVDHTFAYTGAVQKLRQLIDDGAIGTIHYYDSVRVNLGLFQHDVSVIWDLAVHDLAIMDFLFDEQPIAVSATGMAHIEGQAENVAYITCFFESSAIAHIHVNWLAPVKIRRTLLGGSNSMVVYDDLEPTEKIKIYEKGVTLERDPVAIQQMRVGYRIGDMVAPRLDHREALACMADHFMDCIGGKLQPRTDGKAGLRVVQTLAAATESMALRGVPLPIEV